MKLAVVGKTVISPLNLGTCVSYELCGDRITIRFLGIVPVGTIQLADIREFRLASRGEPSGLAFAMNWILYYCWRPAHKPIYLLRTPARHCFLKLSHQSQQQLRSAISRSRESARTLKKAA